MTKLPCYLAKIEISNRGSFGSQWDLTALTLEAPVDCKTLQPCYTGCLVTRFQGPISPADLPVL